MMNMATIHISEAEAIRDIRGLLARAYLGEEIIIEKDAAPAIVLRKATPNRAALAVGVHCAGRSTRRKSLATSR